MSTSKEAHFLVSARKYRPDSFDTVIGQKAVVETLVQAIHTDHLAHAYLFCGPRGVGKTSCARIFAKEIYFKFAPEPKEQDLMFHLFELDAASNNSVDDIRQLIEQVRIQPQKGKYKIYIIDEVHMLSQSAFNAFLKTLEEPPKHVIFILATTEKHKILPTILSRCQVFDFHRIKPEDTVAHLQTIATKEGVKATEEALYLIAQKAEGGMRDALSLYDQMVNGCQGEITHEKAVEHLHLLDASKYLTFTEPLLHADMSFCLNNLQKILEQGFDLHQFLLGLAEHFRNLLIAKSPETQTLLAVAESFKQQYLEQAKKVEKDWIFLALQELSYADLHYKNAKNQRLLTELTLLKLCSLTEHLKKKTLIKL